MNAEIGTIRTALNSFAEAVLSRGNCEDFEILLAGFSGAADLKVYTDGFVRSREELSPAIAEVGRNPVDDKFSTNLYGASMKALQLLEGVEAVDGMALLTFSDGTE